MSHFSLIIFLGPSAIFKWINPSSLMHFLPLAFRTPYCRCFLPTSLVTSLLCWLCPFSDFLVLWELRTQSLDLFSISTHSSGDLIWSHGHLYTYDCHFIPTAQTSLLNFRLVYPSSYSTSSLLGFLF